MIICAYDTETTGVHKPVYPVEIAAVLIEFHKDKLPYEHAYFNLIIRPDGWEIPEASSKVHGIKHELALKLGIPSIVAVSALTNLWSVADFRVAHNAEYDDGVIDAAIERLGRKSTLPRPPVKCTKELAAPVLNLPPTEKMLAVGYDKPKAPKLEECYRFLFNEELAGAHNALIDARACARVFIELTRRGAV